MKHLLSILILFSCILTTSGQNLVPNPNFALYDTCPSDVGQISKCKYWYSSINTSPDYFNVCNDTLTGGAYVGVPNNHFGTQSSSTNAYIGIITFIGLDRREYVGTNIPALLPGAVYRVLVKVSLGDYSHYATDAPCVFFFKDIDTFVATLTALPYTPQITYNATGNIVDKTNWTTLIDTFTADSAYTHLIVGNFNDDASTSTTTFVGGTLPLMSYFYIDSISVEKIADPSLVNNANAIAETMFTLYPNPNQGTFTLQLPDKETYVAIRDITGRQVKEFTARGTANVRMNVVAGLYFVEAVIGDTKWYSKVIISP